MAKKRTATLDEWLKANSKKPSPAKPNKPRGGVKPGRPRGGVKRSPTEGGGRKRPVVVLKTFESVEEPPRLEASFSPTHRPRKQLVRVELVCPKCRYKQVQLLPKGTEAPTGLTCKKCETTMKKRVKQRFL